MSIVRTEITLKNAVDVGKACEGLVKDSDIRQLTLKATVDTGAWTLVINEATRKELGLRVKPGRWGTLADGTRANYNMAGPVEVHWKDRFHTCDAILLPEAKTILMGALVLEGMDLIVHPLKEEVVGAHGDEETHYIL